MKGFSLPVGVPSRKALNIMRILFDLGEIARQYLIVILLILRRRKLRHHSVEGVHRLKAVAGHRL